MLAAAAAAARRDNTTYGRSITTLTPIHQGITTVHCDPASDVSKKGEREDKRAFTYNCTKQ